MNISLLNKILLNENSYSHFHKQRPSIFFLFILNVLFNQLREFNTFLLVLIFNVIKMSTLVFTFGRRRCFCLIWLVSERHK